MRELGPYPRVVAKGRETVWPSPGRGSSTLALEPAARSLCVNGERRWALGPVLSLLWHQTLQVEARDGRWVVRVAEGGDAMVVVPLSLCSGVRGHGAVTPLSLCSGGVLKL